MDATAIGAALAEAKAAGRPVTVTYEDVLTGTRTAYDMTVTRLYDTASGAAWVHLARRTTHIVLPLVNIISVEREE